MVNIFKRIFSGKQLDSRVLNVRKSQIIKEDRSTKKSENEIEEEWRELHEEQNYLKDEEFGNYNQWVW